MVNPSQAATADSAESIKDKILSRISKIEERRRASNANEGVRSFNLDISSIQESIPKHYESIKSQNKYFNRKVGEENLSENEESTHMNEKVMSTKPSSDHYSAQNIAHSSVPRRNLTTYNSTLPDQLNGAAQQDIKESQVISHRVCTRDSHISNENVIPAPLKMENKPAPQNEVQQGFELVTACYEYKAQKVTNFLMKKK